MKTNISRTLRKFSFSTTTALIVLQQQPLISQAFISTSTSSSVVSPTARTTATSVSTFYQQQHIKRARRISFFSSSLLFGMSTHVTERDGSGTITVSPRNEAAQSGLIVICHGLGDTAEGKNGREMEEREREGTFTHFLPLLFNLYV